MLYERCPDRFWFCIYSFRLHLHSGRFCLHSIKPSALYACFAFAAVPRRFFWTEFRFAANSAE